MIGAMWHIWIKDVIRPLDAIEPSTDDDSVAVQYLCIRKAYMLHCYGEATATNQEKLFNEFLLGSLRCISLARHQVVDAGAARQLIESFFGVGVNLEK